MLLYSFCRNFDFLIPDAPELVSNFLEGEQDMACRRNAFLMLLQVDQKRALDYLTSFLDQIGSFGDILQLVIVELIYKVLLTRDWLGGAVRLQKLSNYIMYFYFIVL